MSAEYDERDSEDEEMGDEEEPSREQDANMEIPTTPEGIEAKVEPAEDVDPALADWLRVDARQTVTEDSETEPESDADSVNDDIDKETDEWIAVEPSGSETLDSFQVLVRLFMSAYAASDTHVVIA
jgi:DNA ligase-4